MVAITSLCTLLLLLVLVLSPHLSSSSSSPHRRYYSSRRFHRRRPQMPRRRFCNRWASSGLFVSRDQVETLQSNRTLNNVFVLQSTQVAFPLKGSCGERLNGSFWEENWEETWEEGDMMPECDEGSAPATAQSIDATILGCCNTVMQVEFPQAVTSVLTRQRHRVLQFASSSQLVHTGRCEFEGSKCVLGGRCTTFYRIQWLLVRGTPLTSSGGASRGSDDGSSDDDDDDGQTTTNVVNPASDMFVPSMVPNHCQCVFT